MHQCHVQLRLTQQAVRVLLRTLYEAFTYLGK
jgi:hypothetical protein